VKLGRRQQSPLARGAESPAVRLLAASAALTGGVAAVAKLAALRRNGHAPGKRKRRYRLEAHETPKQGIARVARGELDLTIGLLEAAPSGAGSPEAVHEARKALKRLRTLLRISRPALDERRYQRESVVFRDAGRELSETRDAQVLLETLDSLLERFGAELPEGTWARLRKELAAGAERAQGNGPSGFDGVLDVLSDARMRVSSWPLPSENGRASLAQGFEGIYRHGRHALRRARDEPTPEHLHELRKRAKDLWHSSELLEPLCPKRMQPLSKRAHRLSDLLGDDHDLSILLEYADSHSELLDESERGLLQSAVELRRQSLREQALRCAASLYRRKPKRMLRRLALT
jgi:CHAD domain-containing protein